MTRSDGFRQPPADGGDGSDLRGGGVEAAGRNVREEQKELMMEDSLREEKNSNVLGTGEPGEVLEDSSHVTEGARDEGVDQTFTSRGGIK